MVDSAAMPMPPHRIALPIAVALVVALVVAACTGTPPRAPSSSTAPPASAGKYYLDDGPGVSPPANLDTIPDAVPRVEPLHRAANRPYAVLGREYVPATALTPYRERGIASWYGRKFHGQKTSIGETYDMYAMTAAHPTLPLPSYARVTNVATGRSVVVRVNDRGPFLHGRIIDLSYAAAHRIGIAQNGSGEVEVQSILPGTLAQSPQASRPPLAEVATAPAITTPLAPPAAVQTNERSPDSPPVAPVTGGYSKSKYVSSFVGFAPAKQPKLLVAVMVDEPQGEIYGGLVAGPAFRDITSFALNYLKIPPDPE